MIEIKTSRLLLRSWRDADLDPWAEMNADPEVRAHLGPLLSREQAAASIRYFQEGIERDGYSFWAVEVLETGEFIGMAGLDAVDEEAPVDGVEIGWRLARSAWGHGYATEAAIALLDYGFEQLGLPEILSITTIDNVRSQAVMRRLGMEPLTEFDEDGVRQVVFRKAR
ncbi:RimJ/RimL family protein N-acetyltransferase [Hamadaea flava]|uniref:GNAT family N-acetyltransferase n=1 Tax=Hamadaea flava TaxID=1742688 RepID=A0ABV8LTI4_9ACTN|nr:GNAT family N-acetyltransferase [Hamadaea flava]MCP2321865.1 RimJ/RimL family protein N-acetyltransferase [Hamadaea flava]